ncbi:MAG: DUF779 domain-containing protein [Cryomorphaceae bacterium]|nr:DUF779 domain-containing protein [Flavobacteriales bacterium]
MTTSRIDLSSEAFELISELKEVHGELMFHQSGGCCDGSSPMCFAKGDFKVGLSDVWLGTIAECDFFMSADQFEYWKHTHLTLDVTEGRGASFSLEIPTGKRFVIKSRIFEEREMENLPPIKTGEEYLEEA